MFSDRRSAKRASPYYFTAHWKTLKRATHERDGWRCTVPGCGSGVGLVCDHIKRRPQHVARPTSADVLANTRTLCALHDRQIKEDRHGKRGHDGQAWVLGSDASGRPLAPDHPWNR